MFLYYVKWFATSSVMEGIAELRPEHKDYTVAYSIEYAPISSYVSGRSERDLT